MLLQRCLTLDECMLAIDHNEEEFPIGYLPGPDVLESRRQVYDELMARGIVKPFDPVTVIPARDVPTSGVVIVGLFIPNVLRS